LQNHLGCDLIDNLTRLARFLAGVSERTVGGNSR
jgi:hypothetical protein